ncbi:DUF998 domain-containing protein [Cryobacterium psychrophilum]|uniref:DUF998 domain-containing protein n=1 Tax=Cryobacterium psychrophilum TaxID=41988 RepID=A0A4Y8KLX0_9MICO|nr:DUF998 domain-containing protein [Cryobacterium psychrophilum]TDW31140.1 uncharacterized protein DUF998 [Cryobacterium psychrophilum]TFD78563.1 DUF998 domain-containing protein [Cryobacterium psychrophilum]
MTVTDPGSGTAEQRGVRSTGRTAARIAMVGVVVYVLVDVVLQFLPPHYSPISEAESNLAVGPYGWIMNLNFVGRMITCLAAATALATLGERGVLRRIGLWLFVLGGVCSGILAFFPTDVHEAGAPGLTTETSVGAVHLAVATVGFVAVLVGICVLTVWLSTSPVLPRARLVALVFTGVGVAGIVFLALTIAVLPDLLGLAERVCLLGILGWVFGVSRSIASNGTSTQSARPAR